MILTQLLHSCYGAVGDLTISPAFNGKTSWNFATDGALALNSTNQYTITPTKNLTLTVKMWGAGGAPGGAYGGANPPTTNIGPGGGGGYSTKSISFTSGQAYIAQVGQGGRRGSASTLRQAGATYLSGGVQDTSSYFGCEGGGYSGIFSSSVSQANALLIAGGGGGGSDSAFAASGGAGGGSSGETPNGGLQSGSGGTSSAGGAASSYNSATAGGALVGGLACVGVHGRPGAGGGGYFGGGGGNVGGGGGGSGYAPSGTTTVGSGNTPGNSGDSVRNGAGTGGTGSTNGSDGLIYISV